MSLECTVVPCQYNIVLLDEARFKKNMYKKCLRIMPTVAKFLKKITARQIKINNVNTNEGCFACNLNTFTIESNFSIGTNLVKNN